MAEGETPVERMRELMDNAEGFFTDAQFRDETDMKQLRYSQAITSALLAMTMQNEIIIKLLKRQAGQD